MRRLAFVVLSIAIASIGIAASGDIVICHHPAPLEDPFGGNPRTISVGPNELQAHLKHGDTLGPCGSTPTPRPTPRPTPKPTPKPTARPTPRPTPTPRATPRQTLPPPSGPVSTVPPTDVEE